VPFKTALFRALPFFFEGNAAVLKKTRRFILKKGTKTLFFKTIPLFMRFFQFGSWFRISSIKSLIGH
jgi:hypothetical protein